MPSSSIPEGVRRLLAERRAARRTLDWQRADALRDEIAALGWQVQDTARSSTARPILAGPPMTTEDTSLVGEPASVAASIQVAAEDHADDLARCLRGLAAHPPSATWELVIVDNGATFVVGQLLDGLDLPVQPILVRSPERLGWADARTLGLRRSRGEISVLLDTSLEPTGDFLAPLLAAFDDPGVGIAGGWGLTSRNARQFDEAAPGEVDAVEGYCLAIRRNALRAVGGFDRRFRFYRNADLDLSFAVRDAGWRALRTEPLPFERHEHRGWASLPEVERDRLSKRNFYRFLEHWGDRPDLLLRAMTAHRVVVVPWLRRLGSLAINDWLAITIGGTIFAWRTLTEAELEHELEHVRQWRRHGRLFPILYFSEALRTRRAGKRWYHDNRFEAAARVAASRIVKR